MEKSSLARRSVSLPRALALAAFVSTLALAPLAAADPTPAPAPPPNPAAKAEATKLSDAFVSVAERVSPSVVQIEVTARDEDADQLLRLFGKTQDLPIAHGLG